MFALKVMNKKLMKAKGGKNAKVTVLNERAILSKLGNKVHIYLYLYITEYSNPFFLFFTDISANSLQPFIEI